MPGLPTNFSDLDALLASDPMLSQNGPANDLAAAYARELANDGPGVTLDQGNAAVPTGPVSTPIEPLGPAAMPTNPAGDPSIMQKAGTSSSYSVGTTGVNFDTLGKLEKQKGYKGDIARSRKQRIGEADAMNDALDPAFAAQEDAARADAGARAAQALEAAGDPEAAKAAANAAAETLGLAGVSSTGAAQRAIAQASVVAKEQEEAAKALQKAEYARAEYTEALNRVKSTVINPNRLVANQPLAFGLQNAVAAIAAISGKPGMTNFANMLNQGMLGAMQRDVDAQMAKLQQNQSVASGFKQVYDMVVSENDTQAQARNKMYGAYLASMEGYIESQMGQHDSEVINAELGKTLAAIRGHRAEVENKNYNDALNRAGDDAKLIIQNHMNNVDAATTRMQIAASERARVQAAKDKALERADKQRAALAENTIISPFASDEGRVAGVAKDEFKGDLAKVSAAASKAFEMSNDLRELAIKIEQHGIDHPGDMAGLAQLQSEFGRRFNVVKEQMAYVIAQNNQPGDPKVSDADRAAAATAVSANPRDWILGAGAGGGIDQLERSLRQNWDAAARQMMKSPDLYNETEQAYLGPRVVQHEYSDTGKAVFGAEGAAGVVEPDRYGYNPKKVGKVERDVEGAKWKKLMAPDVDTPTEKLGKQLTDVDTNGTSTIAKDRVPDWYKSYLLTDEGKFLGKYADDSVVGDKVKIPDFAQPMYNLAYRAQLGDAEARSQLKRTAGLQGDRYVEQREMAQWVLDNLGSVNFGIEGTDYMTRDVDPAAALPFGTGYILGGPRSRLEDVDQSVIDAVEQTRVEAQAAATRKKVQSGHGGIK